MYERKLTRIGFPVENTENKVQTHNNKIRNDETLMEEKNLDLHG